MKTEQQVAEKMKLTLDYDELTNCMRCGFCLPSCPTFVETGIEAASPRGRIALMKAVVDDIMPANESFRAQMDLCLGCRACEPACPADVKYGQLLETTKSALEAESKHRWRIKLVRVVMLKHVFPHPKRMRLLGAGLRFYQRSGMRAFIRRSGMMRLLPKHMRQMELILPEASSKGVIEQLGTYYPAVGTPLGTVGMFRGCLMDVLFAETNVNTVKLLAEAGFNVVIPDTQSCCGALHAHSGEMELAKEQAKSNIQSFREAGVDYIVSNAGGCGALLSEYDHLLQDDTEFVADAAWFAERVKDVSQLIIERGLVPQFEAKQPVTITYQDSCHLTNVMKGSSAPRELIHRVDGVCFNEMAGANTCCGSAGIYNLTQPEMSMQILDDKMEHVKHTEAHYLLTSNPGCFLQMKLGVEREGLSERMEVKHIVDFLAEQLKRD